MKLNNICIDRIALNYIFYCGERKSKALKVSNIIINMLRNKSLDKKDVEEELKKSNIFNSYNDLVKFRKMVKTDIINILNKTSIDNLESVILNPEFIQDVFNSLFITIDTDPRYFEFYRKEFINVKDTKV